jgi:hypothetical protein
LECASATIGRGDVRYETVALGKSRHARLERAVWLDGDGAAIKIVATHVASSDFAQG